MGAFTLVAGLENCGGLNLAKKLMGQTGFWCVDINLGKLKVGLITGPLSYGGSYKITVVCLSVPSVSSAFFSGMTH